MAELNFSSEEIAAALRRNVEDVNTAVAAEQVGYISEVGDGIAHITGLPNASVNELLEFESGAVGLAMNLTEDSIGAVVLGNVEGLEEGQVVRSSGPILSIPVGDSLLGRVVNPLGVPLDGKGPIENAEPRRLEIQAPGIVGRQPVTQPLQTGIKVIDAITPIGRGQRELIIGDRKTGKTTVAIDTIINQRGTGVKCIYVAIGQKGSTVAETVATLEAHGALEYTVVVAAPASEPAPFKYLAPYAGCAIGQHWMEQGDHALVVYDDLSKQADAYRQLSLLLRRPPGREAYPGDVFYLHSRLLERAAKLSDELGGGSLTALPIIETKAGDISAYIPTNVISITDGQIFLETDLFNAGIRPAMNVGNSVSRVGGAAQTKAMRSVVGSLKVDLAQFRDLEAFATFGSELDKSSQAQLDRGYRLTELLKQGLHDPMPVEEQVIIIYAGVKGLIDEVPVADVTRFEAALRQHLRSAHSDMLEQIRSTGQMPNDEAVIAAINEIKAGFAVAGDEASPVASYTVAGGKERELRGRIRSINATKKITRAMELIAASQIGRARARIAGSAPYVDGIEAVLAQTARDAGQASRLVGRPEQPANVMVVLLAGDRGQAGAYNTSVFRQAERLVTSHVEQGRTNRLVTVGRKAIGYFRFRGQTPAVSFTAMSDRPTFEDARKVAAEITGPFLAGEIDLVELVSTRYVSAGTQVVTTIQVLPLELVTLADTEGDTVVVDHADGGGFYDYEPDPTDLLRLLVPRYTEAVIFRALLEASASEHTARQRAMAAATENAEELITNYSRQMNRARQDSITTEIMEIVSGAEALRSAGLRGIDVDALLRATEEHHV